MAATVGLEVVVLQLPLPLPGYSAALLRLLQARAHCLDQRLPQLPLPLCSALLQLLLLPVEFVVDHFQQPALSRRLPRLLCSEL